MRVREEDAFSYSSTGAPYPGLVFGLRTRIYVFLLFSLLRKELRPRVGQAGPSPFSVHAATSRS